MSADPSLKKKPDRPPPRNVDINPSPTLRRNIARFSISQKKPESPKETDEKKATLSAPPRNEATEDEKRTLFENLSAEEKKEYRRNEAIKELIETEHTYVEDLKVVVEVYIQALKKRLIIEPRMMKAIFSNIEMIYNVNLEFAKAFRLEREKPPPEQRFGAKILELVEYLKAYTQYSSDQDSSLQTIRSLRSNPDFSKFLEECQRNPRSKGATLLSYLIKPIQRLCKYPLLLKQIQTYLSEDHLDYNNITVAIDKVEKVVAQVNDSKNKIENVMKIMEIQNNIEGAEHLVQPGRKYIKEGTITCPSKKVNKLKERYLFFFSDLLILCKLQTIKKKTNFIYQLKHYIPLKGCLIEEVKDLEENDIFQLSPLNDEEFNIIVPEKIKLFIKNSSNQDWISSITESIIDNTPDPIPFEPILESIVIQTENTNTQKRPGRAGPGSGIGTGAATRPGASGVGAGRGVKQKFATVKMYTRRDPASVPPSTAGPGPAPTSGESGAHMYPLAPSPSSSGLGSVSRVHGLSNEKLSTTSTSTSTSTPMHTPTSTCSPSITTTTTTSGSSSKVGSPSSGTGTGTTRVPTLSRSPLAATGEDIEEKVCKQAQVPSGSTSWIQFRGGSQRESSAGTATPRSNLLGAYDPNRGLSSSSSSIFAFSTRTESPLSSSLSSSTSSFLSVSGPSGAASGSFVTAAPPRSSGGSLLSVRESRTSVNQSCPIIGFKNTISPTSTSSVEQTSEEKKEVSSPPQLVGSAVQQRLQRVPQKSATIGKRHYHSSTGM